MLAAEQLLLGKPVVERRQPQRRHLAVGAGEFDLTPQLQVVGAEFVVGAKPIDTDNAALGCSFRLVG